MDFAPGDVVQLKSGGPTMTVEKLGKDPKTQEEAVYCTWFDKVGSRQELNREWFSPVLIQKYDALAAFGVVRI
jgi:uncharacterized protein YodC (DUF2158 family)